MLPGKKSLFPVGLLDLAGKVTTILRNVGNYSPADTV
jgi:hypothetical protein